MKKSTAIIIALISLIIGLILGLLLSGKFVAVRNEMDSKEVKEYFDRTYVGGPYLSLGGSLKVVFHKDKKFECIKFKTYDVLQEVPDNSQTEEILYSGTYYYNKVAKVILFEYEKDGEKWSHSASWDGFDNNKQLKWPTGTNSNGTPVYTTLILEEDD